MKRKAIRLTLYLLILMLLIPVSYGHNGHETKYPVAIKVGKPVSDKPKLTAVAEERGITFNWTKPSQAKNIIGYNLYRGTSSGKQSGTPITDFPIEGTTYTDYNINSDTTYYYILRAVYRDKTLGPASNEVSVIFRAITLEAKTSEDGIYLKWNKPWNSKNITGYNLYRSTSSGKQSGTPVTDFPIEGTSHTDKNIKPNTIYYYILKPVYKDKTLGNATNEVFAKSGSKTITILLEVGNRYMYVNGERREIDPGMETNVIINSGRAFLPIRAVIEAMGGKVEWRQSDRRASIFLDNKIIYLWIGNKAAKVDGKDKETDVAPYISNTGRTMLPLRFIAENLDCQVDWDGPTKRITIVRSK